MVVTKQMINDIRKKAEIEIQVNEIFRTEYVDQLYIGGLWLKFDTYFFDPGRNNLFFKYKGEVMANIEIEDIRKISYKEYTLKLN